MSEAFGPLGFETRGDGLATDLGEADGTVQVRRGIVPHRDVEGDAWLVAAREPAHRGLQERSPYAAPAAVLGNGEFRDERDSHPIVHVDSAYYSVAFVR